MNDSRDCRELEAEEWEREGERGVPGRRSLPPAGCPHPHHIPVHPDLLQG